MTQGAAMILYAAEFVADDWSLALGGGPWVTVFTIDRNGDPADPIHSMRVVASNGEEPGCIDAELVLVEWGYWLVSEWAPVDSGWRADVEQ